MAQLTPAAKVGIVLIVGLAAFGGYKYYMANKKVQPVEQVDTSNDVIAPTVSAPAPVQQAPVQQAVQVVPNKDALKSIVGNGVVRISVENPSAPFYTDDNGQISGFNVEFAHLLFAQQEFGGKPIQIDTRHEVQTYAEVPKQLLATDNSGNATVDIAMDGLTFDDDEPHGVVYSVPYITDFGYALIVGPDTQVRGTADLSGKTIGILKGDPDVKAFVSRMYPSASIKTISDSDPHFIDKSLDGHIVDAFIYDYPFAVESIKGTDLKFAITKLDGSDISYKIGVRASDDNLLIHLNSAIAKIKTSPAYLDLLRKYFISNQVVTTSATSSERQYKVKQGDTLNMIASSQLGSGARYTEIQKRNNLPNPNLILVGQTLVIPAR